MSLRLRAHSNRSTCLTNGRAWIAARVVRTTLIVATCFGVDSAALNADADPSGMFQLTVGRDSASPKLRFELNGQPYYPIIYSEFLHNFTPQLLADVRAKGFNMVQVALDAEEADSPRLAETMTLCQEAGLPVLLEVNEWKFWGFLKDRPELNMVMWDGTRVKHFPDYANPETRREHLARYAHAADAARRWAHQPVVAVSVGAYDAYHLPDGEIHDDFVVPEQTSEFQTRLAYGSWSAEAFRRYLATSGVNAATIGVKSFDEPIELPTTPEDALGEEHWRQWILYRRSLVKSWLADTVETMRQRTGLPVGVSLDLDFTRREKYATPPFEWSGVLDFASVYCYGREPDAGYVPGLMRSVWREYTEAGVPLIGFLEFSSGLAGATPGDAYARQCAPFVAGLMTTSARPDRKHGQDRVDSFVGWATGRGQSELLSSAPIPAKVLVVSNRSRIYSDRSVERALAKAAIPFDVEYADSSWKPDNAGQYGDVVVDAGIALPANCATESGPRVLKADELPALLDRMHGDRGR
jgi:hypothetical protein